MARLNRNIFANFSGQAWSMGLSLIFTPIYIHALGVESYGLIGIYLLLLGLVQVFDFGLGATINRALSSGFHLFGDRPALKTLIRTAEIIYVALALLLAALLMLGADSIVGVWINVGNLNRENVEHIVMLMGVLLGLQWLIGLYQNVLMGMQEQATANIVTCLYATVANATAAVLILVAHTGIEIFFICIGVMNVFQLIHLWIICWRKLGSHSGSESFRFDTLKRSWGFTVGVAAISIISVLLTQLDKILLSKLLSLSEFGVYVLAGTLSKVLYVLINPVFSAVFPRLSSAISQGDFSSVIKTYHSTAQLMAVLVLSAAFSMAIFSHDAFVVWLHSETMADSVAPVAAVLAFGTALNGLMNVPYAMQLAKGFTRIPFLTAVVIAVLFVPCMVWATGRFGTIGAAWTWFALNFLYLIIGVTLTHLLLLPGEFRRWLVQDTGKPLLAIACAAVVISYLHDFLVLGVVGKIVAGLLGSMAIFFVATLSAREIRTLVYSQIHKMTLSRNKSS